MANPGKYTKRFADKQKQKMGLKPAEEHRGELKKIEHLAHTVLADELGDRRIFNLFLDDERFFHDVPQVRLLHEDPDDWLKVQSYAEAYVTLEAIASRIIEGEGKLRKLSLDLHLEYHIPDRRILDKLKMTGTESGWTFMGRVIMRLKELHDKGGLKWDEIVTEDFEIICHTRDKFDGPKMSEAAAKFVEYVKTMRAYELGHSQRRQWKLVGVSLAHLPNTYKVFNFYNSYGSTMAEAIFNLYNESGYHPDEIDIDHFDDYAQITVCKGTPNAETRVYVELPTEYEKEKVFMVGEGIGAEGWTMAMFQSESSVAKTVTRHPEADVLVLKTTDHGDAMTSVGYVGDSVRKPLPWQP